GSDDENYAGIEESVTVTITDDDEAGVLVVPPTSPIIEGATITYTLHLTSEPPAPVMVTPSEVLPSESLSEWRSQLRITPPMLTFTAADWHEAKTVAVEAVDDAIDETSPHTVTITHALSSIDPNYDDATRTFTVSDALVEIVDN